MAALMPLAILLLLDGVKESVVVTILRSLQGGYDP